MSLLTAKVTKTAAVGMQRTQPNNVQHCRCCVALTCASPHTPCRQTRANKATLHHCYKKGTPLLPQPRLIFEGKPSSTRGVILFLSSVVKPLIEECCCCKKCTQRHNNHHWLKNCDYKIRHFVFPLYTYLYIIQQSTFSCFCRYG